MSATQSEFRSGNPTGRPPGRTKLETLEIRSRIVDMARQGWSQRAIASEVGFAPSAIHKHLEVYRATLAPSSELAEEWRQTRLARADERFRRLLPLALGERDAAGNWLTEPDLQALQALQREEESITKMLGANLEQSLQVQVVTAEAMCELFRLDTQQVVEVEATEVTDGGDA